MLPRILVLALLFGTAQAQVTLRVTNASPAQGTLYVSVFNQAEGFPNKPERAYKTLQLPVKVATLETQLDLPPGRYAIGLHHDVNGNGKMDANFLGIPKEPYGASNNAKGSMGPPKFQDAAFTVAAGTPQVVAMQLMTF